MHREEYYYVIDHRDSILTSTQCGSDESSWNKSNDGCRAEGHPVWDFIDGDETQQLYQELFKKVRSGCSMGPIPFRCDSAQERVFMELFLEPLGAGKIGVSSRFVKVEPRDPVRLFDVSVPRSKEFLTICCMCKKVKESEVSWIEVEQAVVKMKLFELDQLPQLSHGICKECFCSVMKEAGLPAEVDF